jgi:hypothetical protein
MAPEVFGCGRFNKSADVYSMAIGMTDTIKFVDIHLLTNHPLCCDLVLWELVCRKEPWANFRTFEIAERVQRGERPELPETVPPEFQDLIRSCWKQV